MKSLFLAACIASLSATAMAAPADDIIAADKAFAAMSLEKGAHAAFLAYMADDVRLFDGEHPPIIGKKAVVDYYAQHPERPDQRLDWKPLEAFASPDGILGYTRGTWIATGTKKDGKPYRQTGYYVTEWRKQTDGTYKFVLDIGGTD